MTFTHNNAVNNQIASEINLCSFNIGKNFALGNCFFGAYKLIKSADPDKYEYSNYGTGFDANGSSLLLQGSRIAYWW